MSFKRFLKLLLIGVSIFLIGLIALTAGVWKYNKAQRDDKYSKGYVEGDVLVGFKDGITEDQASEILKSYGLTDVDYSSTYGTIRYEVNILNNTPSDYTDNLRAHDTVMRVTVPGTRYKGEPAGRMTVSFSVYKTTPEAARQLIESYDGLEIDDKASVIEEPRLMFVKVSVPPGSEKEWVERLQEDPDIIGAGLNNVTRLDTQGGGHID